MKGIVQDVERFHGNRLSIHGNGDIFERRDLQREGSGMDEESSFGIESVSEGIEEYGRGRKKKEAGKCPEKQPSARR
jgi:hypothetical protein